MSAEATRMQDLSSEFSKIFRGNTPDPQREGATPFRTQPSPAFGRARGASALVLGPKPWSPSTFQPWLRPWLSALRASPLLPPHSKISSDAVEC